VTVSVSEGTNEKPQLSIDGTGLVAEREKELPLKTPEAEYLIVPQ
jgi:hypothetical protein